MAKTIRVYKASDGQWAVKRDGTSRPAAKFGIQKDAYLYARDIALRNGLTITVYYPNGGIKAVINPRNKGEEESNCFITTSCVKYFGLEDDCYELETLRKFRDHYLLKTQAGRELVSQYYEVAPALVKKLEADSNRNELFNTVFDSVKSSCRAIEEKRYEDAKEIYREAVSRLFKYFKTV